MFPLRDNIPSRYFPVVLTLIVVACSVAWLFQLSLSPEAAEVFVRQFGLVPERFADPHITAKLSPEGLYLPLLSSQFLHGSWMHVVGNLWMLWIFGDNIEDYLGTLRFLLFYLLCGVGAGVVHIATNWGSPVPTIGASGAISGVMAAYLFLYPRARITTIVPLFVVFFPIAVPAVLFIGGWFVMQFLQGTASLMAAGPQTGGGIAWWAHIGGFVSGAILVKVLGFGRQRADYVDPADWRQNRARRRVPYRQTQRW